MALQNYRYVPGTIIIIGKQPDGDSVRFRPDDENLLADIYRAHLLRPAKDGSHQLRLEGIDTPETHYESKAQPHGGVARDYLLRDLIGFSSFSLSKETVTAAEPQTIQAGILTASADVHGRPISYLTFDGNPFSKSDTGAISTKTLEASANYRLISSGMAYPMLYSSAPVDQRQTISEAARQARDAGLGVWAVDKTERFALTDLTDLGWASGSKPGEEEEDGTGKAQLIFPKLFRRGCDFLKSGETDLVEWLRKTESENDKVIIDNRTEVPLSQLLRRENDRYRFDADLTQAVFVEK
ncbi:thermonuclease family protein [Agrobacterium vitis]|uniref:thermonuclease family protein n=1 Tax=Agrobacterium vitis TaxID=373 RepID=UPI00087308AF|nr:thermonuclease family protein [Agrobacterium vitis]MCE6074718.1 nuclease [Agrobacterium vitis]MCF1451384.1 nuclease [Agrobacterium vitis]MCF1467287.1 nuclease [Agrobacterium vitis]MCM2467877.1 nuclease [Agrobacterium vitis]MUO68218.1 nuclease [Agrobacterium vitis]